MMMHTLLCLTVLMCTIFRINGTYTESNILQLIKLYIPNNPIILEAGAHYGEDTEKMKNVWPESTIHTFEPHPESYKHLARRVRGLSGVTCYPLALSDTNGTAKFYCCGPNEGASSLLESTPSRRNFYKDLSPIMVECLTLDEWGNRHNVNHIDFCWLDMEGAELRMLQNALTLLPTVKVIYIEVNFQEFRTGMAQYTDIHRFLTQHGFQEVWMSPGKRPVYEDEQANVLFVRKDLIPCTR